MRPLRETHKGEFSAIKYVLTDIDDTLTYRSRLSARTYTALERLQNAGIKVIPVTAAPAGWCDLMVRMWPIDAVMSYRRILVTSEVRRQRLELAI